jgi:leader peptidase (prepilin peptidase)/N-methyltransferase
LPLLAVASVATHDLGALGRTAAGAAGAFLLFGLIFVVAPGGMGFGDVRLAGCCGAFLGWIGYRTLAVGLLLGFLSAGVVAIALVLAGRARRKTALPFGPFLALGTVVAVLAGAPIAHLWLG